MTTRTDTLRSLAAELLAASGDTINDAMTYVEFLSIRETLTGKVADKLKAAGMPERYEACKRAVNTEMGIKITGISAQHGGRRAGAGLRKGMKINRSKKP